MKYFPKSKKRTPMVHRWWYLGSTEPKTGKEHISWDRSHFILFYEIVVTIHSGTVRPSLALREDCDKSSGKSTRKSIRNILTGNLLYRGRKKEIDFYLPPNSNFQQLWLNYFGKRPQNLGDYQHSRSFSLTFNFSRSPKEEFIKYTQILILKADKSRKNIEESNFAHQTPISKKVIWKR